MRVGLDLSSKGFVPALHPPDGRPRDKKPLLRRKPVNSFGSPMVLKIFLKPIKSHQKATQIANIFTQCELSLHIYTFKWLIIIILSHQFPSSFPEVIQIFFLPPIL